MSSIQHLFSSAVDELLSEVARQDAKGPFFAAIKELREQHARDPLAFKEQQQSQQCADELRAFLRHASEKRKQSVTFKVVTKLEPFISSLCSIAGLCENLLQAGPMAVAVVFSGARVLLGVAIKMQECFESILEAITDIDIYLRCYERIFKAHSHSRDMQLKLITAYKNVLQFWWKATKVLSEKALVTLAKGIFRPVDHEIADCLRLIKADRESIQFLVISNEAELSYEARHDQLKDRIVPWIRAGQEPSKLDVRHELAGRLQIYQEGTCSWILDHPGYKQWYGSPNSSVLWYNASPGSGKSILASTVINRLRHDGHRVIYYFCSYDDPTLRQHLNIFRSIALQLLKLAERVPDGLKKTWEEDQENFLPMLANHSAAEKVVHELLKVIPRVHIVIDGLDECLHSEGDQGPPGSSALSMIECLVSLASQRHGIAKWFLTSRNEGPIGTSMAKMKAIQVTPSEKDLESDIKSYVTERLKDSQSAWCRQCVAEAAAGNFLYAKLRTDTLLQEGLTCEQDIHEEMSTWPRGLTGCYLRSLDRLKKRSMREQELARRTVLILVITKQPLSLNELRDALAARLDSDDYSAARLPSSSLIQDLCGAFISMDRTIRGTHENPMVKLSHKSVQDLVLSDPEEIGVSHHLRKYFISKEDGHLEMGRICLAYLKYKRYLAPSGLLADFETDPEHAFVRYAAVFWFQHLNRCRKPTSELRAEVRAFLRSPAIWSCVRVQSRIARYFFARYVRGPSRGFNIHLQGSGWGEADHIATTIPVWMGNDNESEDHALVREFHRFMLEWSEALASGRDALLQCPMRSSGVETFPGRSKFMDKSIRRSNIGPQLSVKDNDFMVDAIYTEKGVFKARLFHRPASARHEVSWTVTAPFSKNPGPSGSFALHESLISKTFGHLLLGPPISTRGIFGFDLGGPKVVMVREEGIKTFMPPPEALKIMSQAQTSNHWCIGTDVRRPASPVSDAAVALHLYLVHHEPRALPKETVAEVPDSSSSDSEDDYDEEEEDEEEEDEEEEDEEELDSGSGEEPGRADSSIGESAPDDETCESPRDLLVVLTEKGDPVWIPQCSRSNLRNQIAGAFHPSQNIFAWILDSQELCIIDLPTGKVPRKYALPVAPNESSSVPSASAIVRELQFSSDGNVLHYLSVAFQAQNEQLTTARIAISAFNVSFDDQNDGSKVIDLKLCCEPVMVTYQFDYGLDKFRMPWAVTHWDNKDSTVYAMLPVLSCSVKVLKIPLFNPKKQDDHLNFQTLVHPIFIPCAANWRKPEILYQANPSKPDDSLYLVLDSHGGPENGIAGSPTVIRWTIPKAGGWRAWDEDEDGRCEELKRDPTIPLYHSIRGSFVEADKTFGVAIRGALDYTKQAFISCG